MDDETHPPPTRFLIELLRATCAKVVLGDAQTQKADHVRNRYSDGLTERGVLSDGDLLGRFIDSFAMAQLRPELASMPMRSRAHHLRTREGRREIDLVVEIGDGRVVGIEFKANAAVARADARHTDAGSATRSGIASSPARSSTLGPMCSSLDRRILAIPLAAMWA